MIFRVIKNYFSIPYQRTLLVTLDNGKQIYCERRDFAEFKANKQWLKDWPDRKGRGGKYKIHKGIWNLFPDDDIGFVPLNKIKDFKYLKNEEDFNIYEAYRFRYYEEHPIELYIPEERDDDTKKFLKWINQPNVQEMIRNWVDGYGYSDAYNWKSPDILMEHIWKAGLKEGRNGRV